jgi:hypothetical protein
MGLFDLKISWDVARAFLTEAALTVLSPDFLYILAMANMTSVILLVILVIFLSLTALMIQFV